MRRRPLRTTRQKGKYISRLRRSQKGKREADHARVTFENVSKAQRREPKSLVLNYKQENKTSHNTHASTYAFKKEGGRRRERKKKCSGQRPQARTSKWEGRLFIRQRISSRTACFSRYLRGGGEAARRRRGVAGTRGTRAPTQLLDTTSHDWGGSYSLSHCRRRRARRALVRVSVRLQIGYFLLLRVCIVPVLLSDAQFYRTYRTRYYVCRLSLFFHQTKGRAMGWFVVGLSVEAGIVGRYNYVLEMAHSGICN